ncbi:MAG: prepilin-type N-terminal cleavage/methylation domain-containing protein [Longimicrobiales bacterium]
MNTVVRKPLYKGGFTLVELIISLTIFGVVITTAVAFMARQNSAFQVSVSRLVALRNLRYAVTTLSQDLETLGTNVPGGQPPLYYAGTDVVVFASDYATNVDNDPFAVFYDPDAPTGQVTAPSTGFAIPNSGVSFPDTSYEATAGLRSPAEVITFFMQADTATTRTDDYRLYRQVNNGEPEVIARNLLRRGSDPFFSYERLSTATGATMLETVPDSLMPIHHRQSLHLGVADTARDALADSVRALVVSMAATNGRTGAAEDTVAITRFIPMPNAGFGVLSTCGSAPILGVGLLAQNVVLTSGDPAVRLSWPRAVDEAGGESDVVRYVIWRRDAGAPTWGDPYLAIPGGAPTYSYEDASVESGDSYEYALAAQDCTPTLSPPVSAGPVNIP